MVITLWPLCHQERTLVPLEEAWVGTRASLNVLRDETVFFNGDLNPSLSGL